MIQVFITYIRKVSNVNCNITVEIVYILPKKQYLQRVILKEKVTVETVIHMSGLLEICKDINLQVNKIGINNRVVRLADKINNGDRIEIYRPLVFNFKKIK